jgi:hypothetical protein
MNNPLICTKQGSSGAATNRNVPSKQVFFAFLCGFAALREIVGPRKAAKPQSNAKKNRTYRRLRVGISD